MRSKSGRLLGNPLTWSVVCACLSLVVLAYPLYVIRPFRHQGYRELAAALTLLRFRPFLEIVFVVAALALLVFAWRQARGIWQKVVPAGCTLFVILFGILSRVNTYELMFHPMDRPAFSPSARAKLDGDEQVIAVRLKGAARAYPIRSMSYHHIVNDVLGGLPIVATY